jgi:hypothetical protein
LNSFKGNYRYSEQGVSITNISATQILTVNIAEAGLIKADGRGNMTTTASAMWEPSPFPSAEQPLTLNFSTGVGEGYTVNADCTGDATFDVTITDKNGLHSMFKFFLVDFLWFP